MKKRILSILLALTMLISVVPLSASAAGGSIYVGGVELGDGQYLASGSDTPSDTQPASGYAHYAGGTLTLNNYSYSGEGYIHRDFREDYGEEYGFVTTALYTESSLSIVLNGTNSIENTSGEGEGISLGAAVGDAVGKAITISGEGTLNINAGYGFASPDGDLNITDGTINISSAGSGIEHAFGNVSITGGTVDINVSEGGVAINASNINISNVSILQPVGGTVTQVTVGNFTLHQIQDASGNSPTRVLIGTSKPSTPSVPGTPSTEEVTIPVSGEGSSIEVDAVISGSTATIENIDISELDSVIGGEVETGTITIDFSTVSTSVSSVQISAEVMEQISEAVNDTNNDAESLEIVFPDGAAIEFDAASLAEKVGQAGGEDITISMQESRGTGAQTSTVGSRPAYDITVESGGETISDLGGTVKLRAPYSLQDGELPDGLIVRYVDENGKKESCNTVYNAASNEVSWETSHLSLYMIDYDEARANNPFADVSSSAYYTDAVLWAVGNGITQGTSADKFSPNASCTRAQAVTFLWRAAGSPKVEGATGFSDVSDSAYYADAVKWAVANGITQGTGNGKFSPNATCNRAQIVTFMYRAEGSPAVSGSTAFGDVGSNDYYNSAVQWAVQNGVTQGTSVDKFSPNSNCIRAQIVTFLYRAYA